MVAVLESLARNHGREDLSQMALEARFLLHEAAGGAGGQADTVAPTAGRFVVRRTGVKKGGRPFRSKNGKWNNLSLAWAYRNTRKMDGAHGAMLG